MFNYKQSSLFGGGAQAAPSSRLFGQAPAPSAFRQPPAMQQQAPGSGFGAPAASSGSLFGGMGSQQPASTGIQFAFGGFKATNS